MHRSLRRGELPPWSPIGRRWSEVYRQHRSRTKLAGWRLRQTCRLFVGRPLASWQGPPSSKAPLVRTMAHRLPSHARHLVKSATTPMA
eukprot:UN2568